jgi:3-oxoacyl-[acyl-carrier protein] reductase
MMDAGVAGRVAVVTGGSRGIGRAIVERLASDGARVALCSRAADQAGRVASEIAARTGTRVVGYGADLAVEDGAERFLAAAAADLGEIEILVNNAAAPVYGDILALSDHDWQRTIAVKLLGYVRCTRVVLPGMITRQSGRIVNVVGIAGERPSPSSVAIGVANAGLLNLTRAVALQVAPHGITVNAVSPGRTATERRIEEGPPETSASGVPIGRWVRPDEVAQAVAMLCGPNMGAVTGAWLQVDGGMIAL